MRSILTCTTCGTQTSKWVGQCPSCGAWGSLAERDLTVGSGPTPVALTTVDAAASEARPTGVAELDRVLGGGLVPGSVTLLGGEPGIGKSTLLLQALTAISADGLGCLLVCAEESASQVKRRADRLGGAVSDGLLALAATELSAVIEAVERTRPAVCVVDSIQAISDGTSPAGSVTQVRECASALARVAKATGTAVIVVGHVTKDGALAGPRTLEHLVDTVLTFEGDRHYALRLLVATKHRFGPTGELGLFEMTDAGLVGIDDPSKLVLSDRVSNHPGSVVVPAIEGRRCLAVEVQALVVAGSGPGGRRSARGIDSARLSQIIAVLEQRANLPMTTAEVFVSAVGGIRLSEPAADFAIALALATAVIGVHLPGRLVAFGEIGLAGELRQVPNCAQRLAEAARLGFRQAFVPHSVPSGPEGMELIRVETLAAAVDRVNGKKASQAAHPTGRRPILTPVG